MTHRRNSVLARLVACLVLPVLLAPSPGMAAPRRDEGKQLADEAAEHFKAGRFVEAAELFERAVALNPDKLVRLRNAGRAGEEAGRLEHARHLFQRYVSLAPDGADRTEVAERLARIEARLAASTKPLPARASPQPPAAEPAHPAPDGATDGAPARATPSEPASVPTISRTEAEPTAIRAGAWTLAASGAALVAVGAVWWGAYGAVQDQYDADVGAGRYAYPGGATKRSDDEASLATNRALALTLTGVGAAATVGGLVWALWPDAPRRAVTVAPWIPLDGCGLVAAARF